MSFEFHPLCLKSEHFWDVFGFKWTVRLLGRTIDVGGGGGGGRAASKNGGVFYVETHTHTAASRYLLMFVDAIFRLEKQA